MSQSLYQVVAQFDDGDSLSYLLIGNFTSQEVAESCKLKWVSFFQKYKSVFDEPEDWIGSKDQLASANMDPFGRSSNYIPDWRESKTFFTLLDQFQPIWDFVTIDINQLPLDEEVFISKNSSSWPVETVQLMTQWNRQVKLNDLV